MSPKSLRCLALFSSLAAMVAGCGGGGGTVAPDDAAVMPDIATAPPDLAKKPDMTNLGTDPVGAPCMNESNCSGNRPVCKKSLDKFQTPIPAPNGYCSDSTCKSDNDCGTGGICVPELGYCLGECAVKGECDKISAGNVCVQIKQDGTKTCIPNPIMNSCNPTDPMSCDKTGACSRLGGFVDDVGQCMTTCVLGGADCKPGAQGQAQACYFLNNRVDVMGKDTTDAFAGTVCLDDASMGAAPDAACMYLNSCSPGYECNFWKAGGAEKLCKKLCHNGGNECVIGTCTNAFLLKNFAMGDVGLCL